MKNKVLNIPLISSILLLIVSVVPYLYLNTDAYVTIHDNLDSELVFYHVLKLNNSLFGFDTNTLIPNVMNGIPKTFFHSEFSLIRLLFFILPPFWAYVANLVLIRLIGFIGMYLLLKDYVLNRQNTFLTLILSLLFALLPYYPLYGISVSGQAILVWAFLNFRTNKHILHSYLIIFFFPFYSHFALIAPFCLVSISILGLHLYGKKLFKSKYFFALILLAITYLAANYITIQNFISPIYVSHRTEWIASVPSLKESLNKLSTILKTNQYHSASFYAIPIYILAFLGIIFSQKNREIIITLLFYVLIIGLIYSFYPFVKFYIGNKWHFLITFNFDRFIFIIPLLWFLIMGFSLKLTKNIPFKLIMFALLFLQSRYIIKENKELVFNYKKTFSNDADIKNIPSYKEFYSTSLFSEIDSIIGLPKENYRVVSLGFFPSIAQYNGFYTLDSYQNNYPLVYKHQFQKIIQPELDKNRAIHDYFINWGSRCYLFSSELKNKCYINCLKNNNETINLSVNTKALKEMNGNYIFSAVKIENYKELHLDSIASVANENSMWKIHLYKLK